MARLTQRRVALIGHPLDHSRSPAMQQAAFDALRLDIRYELWDTPNGDLRKRVDALRQPDMLGANVTIPHKLSVMSYLDSRASTARFLAGAVNTIVREETPHGVRLVGHNTDSTALLRILDEQRVWRPDLRALVLGAGGAAQAALGAILLRGGQPWVAARKRSAARQALEALYARREEAGREAAPGASGVSGIFPIGPFTAPDRLKTFALALDDNDALARVLPETRLLINATPIGTRDPQTTPFPMDLLRRLPRDAFVLDLVYNPPETALVRAAHAIGLRATGGLSMLLYQGAEAFTLWTGYEAPLAAMRQALEASL
ncbi:MAG TPA: shikimate dehydrogenase [Ktedonobacterales bacterium]|jgi:shikimate dehydrogenase|nr:shikimate dehydrogenase [Ktedonobacterales bacterium]